MLGESASLPVSGPGTFCCILVTLFWGVTDSPAWTRAWVGNTKSKSPRLASSPKHREAAMALDHTSEPVTDDSVISVFSAAMSLPESERAEFVDRVCIGNSELLSK